MGSPWEVGILFTLVAAATAAVISFGPEGGARRGLSFFAGWLLPGAGHIMMGRWGKGLFFFAILSATWLFGLWITGFQYISFDANPFHYIGQYGCGGAFLVAHGVLDGPAYPREGVPPSWFDPGTLYVAVACLLNLVVMMNVLQVKPVERTA